MGEEPSTGPTEKRDGNAWREARRREARWWRGGLIAAVVLLAVATLYNGVAYRRLARSQQNLVMSLARQSQTGFGPMGQPGPGPMEPPNLRSFGGPYGPFPGPWAFGRGGCGWRRHHREEREQGPGGQGREPGPGGQATPQSNG